MFHKLLNLLNQDHYKNNPSLHPKNPFKDNSKFSHRMYLRLNYSYYFYLINKIQRIISI